MDKPPSCGGSPPTHTLPVVKEPSRTFTLAKVITVERARLCEPGAATQPGDQSRRALKKTRTSKRAVNSADVSTPKEAGGKHAGRFDTLPENTL